MLTRTHTYFTSHPFNRDAEQTIREEIEFLLMHDSEADSVLMRASAARHADEIDLFNNVGCEFDERIILRGSLEDPEYY
jgi:hypothetical protein